MPFGAPLRREISRLGTSRRRRLLLLLLGAPLIGLLGAMLAEGVPDGRIASHLTEAVRRGELTSEDRTLSSLGTTADHYAECTAVMIGLGDRAGSTIVRRALFSSSSFGCVPAVDQLEWFGATGELRDQPDYMRYWHGYAVFTRPGLAIFGLTGTRWLAFGLLAAAIVAYTYAVLGRFGRLPALLVLVPGLLTTDMILGGFSISHAIGLATAWAGGWIVLNQVNKERSWTVAALAAGLGGALNAYFDLMVAIPASLTMCTVAAGLAMMSAGERGTATRTATAMLAAAGGWAVGFTGMWSSKWALAWLFVDRRRIVDSVRNQIEFRTGGEFDGVTRNRFTGLTKNLSTWFDQPVTPLVILAAIAALAAICWLRFRADPGQRGWSDLGGIAAGLAAIVIPFASWYVLLNNHNQIHYWLTYRSIAIAFGAMAAYLAVAISSGVATLSANGVDEAITSEPSEERVVRVPEPPH